MNIASPKAPEASPAVQTWISTITAVVNALVASGTTAQRPTKLLWTGRPYYDETLSIPVYYNAASATGWRNAAGVNV